VQQSLKFARDRARRKALFRLALSRKHGIFFLILFWITLPASAGTTDAPGHLTEIVRSLCSRLQLDVTIEIRIDENNDKMVSTEPLSSVARGYRISFDRRFLETLNDDEIAGAIAHELGHVWIFTHFPYLQTEELANEIALRVVTRDTMKHVYSRLWARTGVAGNLDELLGPELRPDGVKSAVALQ